MTGPTFLVVGAGRSGTTGLVEGLRGHPEVFVTTPKEPDHLAYAGQQLAFRGPGDDLAVNRPAVTGLADYLALYPSDGGFTALGEASVSTLYHYERAIPGIQRIAPDARIVVLLREPVARAHSAFDYLAGQGRESAPTLLDAVADEDRRVRDGWAHLWHYTRMSRYADAVEAFLEAFGPDRVGVWFHDNLSDDYPGTLGQVLRFVGTAPHPGELDRVPVVNVSGTPRSRLVHGAMQAARGNEAVRRLGQRVTTFRVREALRRRLVTKHDVDPGVRRELEPLFADDLARLSRLLPAEGQPDWLRAARDDVPRPSSARAR
ncbi:sulfotransferase [Nocardioides sp.]|uniref:sulfotransferase n=1 Tax=Nocardioides sp. TaxID=35761 RepID=UPI001A297DEC|nr:sulfotransferase [Nocardioides sp.]MBJ7357698.1 sulfotransferase [Nocardioides sp.]